MTFNMWLASVAWILLAIGYCRRRNKAQHVPLMLTGITLDITLVLYLQFTREAIQTALSFSLTPWQQIHIGFSTAALLLYFPILYLGFRLQGGNCDVSLRQLHIRLGTLALILRTLGLIFMFSMWTS